MTCTSTCIQPSPTNAHCGACHVTFGAVSGFDRHRKGGECHGPALMSMHRDRRGVWRQDGRDPHADTPSASASERQGCETGPVVPESTPDGFKPAETRSGGPEVWSDACVPDHAKERP